MKFMKTQHMWNLLAHVIVKYLSVNFYITEKLLSSSIKSNKQVTSMFTE